MKLSNKTNLIPIAIISMIFFISTNTLAMFDTTQISNDSTISQPTKVVITNDSTWDMDSTGYLFNFSNSSNDVSVTLKTSSIKSGTIDITNVTDIEKPNYLNFVQGVSIDLSDNLDSVLNTATLKMVISKNVNKNDIDLYYYNDSNTSLTEINDITINGDTLIGTVSHFSTYVILERNSTYDSSYEYINVYNDSTLWYDDTLGYKNYSIKSQNSGICIVLNTKDQKSGTVKIKNVTTISTPDTLDFVQGVDVDLSENLDSSLNHATLKIKIAEGTSTNNIGLYYYDTVNDSLSEIPNITITNDTLIGTVSHFSTYVILINNRTATLNNYSIVNQNISMNFTKNIVKFSMSSIEKVSIDLYNISGRHIANLFNGISSIGINSINVSNMNIATGNYILRLKTNNKTVNSNFNLIR